ncbi:MAG TPA: universal stress protein [Salinivirgaceae bacterium]|nr:universal stress protein [Salinivirgaceae bacterium]
MEQKLITIATEKYSRAVILKSFLESNGIECSIRNVNLIQPNVADGVKLIIKESDVEKAIKLLSKQAPAKNSELIPGKILVPIDFSAISANAAKFAVRLAEIFHAEVKLLHVYHSPTIDMIPFRDVGSIQIDFEYNTQMIQKEARSKLLNFYNEIRNFINEQNLNNVRLGYALREGYINSGIVETAIQDKPSLIVMGTRSRGFESIELVGNIAVKVAGNTNIPILVLPEKAYLSEPTNVNKIVYAAHLDGKDAASIRKLLALVSSFNVSIKCIYACDEPDSSIVKAVFNQLKEYLSKVVKNAPIDYELVHSKDVSKTFKKYIMDNDIDLFALTMRKRSAWARIFNPSLTREMLAQADIPMLIFPD